VPDIDDLYQDPNAGAYEKEEVRTGPPLSYVGEKLRRALESAHRMHRTIVDVVPDDLPQPPGASGTAYSTKVDGLVRPAHGAFYYSLVAFLALHNALGRIGGDGKVDALLRLDPDEFGAWLDTVEQEGSVTG